MKLVKRYEYLLIFLVFSFLSLTFFWPVFLGKVNLNANLLVSFYPIYGENLPYKNIVGLDQIRLYYPNFSLIAEQIKNLEIPYWNPYIFSGNLNIASLQSAVFYPLNIFIFILPFLEFWHLLRISPYVLGAFFTYLYLRNLKLEPIPAIFGAVSFGFGVFVTTWGEEQVNTPHTIIWLPLILFCIDKVRLYKNIVTLSQKTYLILIALAIAFSVFAGFIQTTIYLVLFSVLYTFFRMRLHRESFRKYLFIFAALMLGFLLSSIQLFPTAELYFLSARSTITLKETLYKFLLPPESLISFLAPDFFGNPTTWNFFRRGIATYYEGIMFIGIPALLFAFYAVFENFKDKYVRFMAISGAAALFLTLDLFTSKLILSLPIPFLSSSIANRLLFIPNFCFVVLAAYGLDLWLKSNSSKIYKYIFIIGLFYLFLIFYLLDVKFNDFNYFVSGSMAKMDTMLVSLRNLVLPLGIFGASSLLIFLSQWKLKEKKKIAAFVILVLSTAHLFLFAQKYMNFSQVRYVFPKTDTLSFIQKNQGIWRSWAIGEAYLENNFSSDYRIFWPEGYNSLNILTYAEFTQAMQGSGDNAFVFRADAGLGRGNSAELLESNSRRKLLDYAAVKYVIAEKSDWQLLERNSFKKVFEEKTNQEGKTFGVFENLTVLPRIFLASNYEGPPEIDPINKTDLRVKELRRKLIPEKLLADDFESKTTIVLEESAAISPQFSESSAEIVSYRANEVVVKTSSGEPKLLYLSDNYFPAWKASVDGNETKILRANYSFRAVPLTGGEHIVRFYFDSLYQKLGFVFSAAGLLIAAAAPFKKFNAN